ncbi:MAG: hypothetical protein IVW54_14485 [Candidatus Binataceae bacterium]|nr:hypothetical protein [Candidatus Binataceae bacterium]
MRLLLTIVYLLCIATSFVCMLLLMRSYRATRNRLMFWSFLCFVGLAANNLLLFIDLVIFPNVDLRWLRNLTAFAAVAVLIYGFIWDTE